MYCVCQQGAQGNPRCALGGCCTLVLIHTAYRMDGCWIQFSGSSTFPGCISSDSWDIDERVADWTALPRVLTNAILHCGQAHSEPTRGNRRSCYHRARVRETVPLKIFGYVLLTARKVTFLLFRGCKAPFRVLVCVCWSLRSVEGLPVELTIVG